MSGKIAPKPKAPAKQGVKGKIENVSFNNPKVVVRFREGVRLPEASPEEQIDCLGIGSWKDLSRDFPGVRNITPVFTALKPDQLRELTIRAQESDPSYKPADFQAFYQIDAAPGTDLVALAKTLLRWNSVQEAYIDQAGPDPVVNPANDPRSVNQGYLDPAPDGIDAEYAWGFAGGDGAGQRFIDLERGWTLNHEDIASHGGTLLHGTLLDSSRSHGTSVLGEICAVDNALGCVGIVPNVDSFDVVSYHGSSRPNAIIAAIANLNFGDALLLEAQVALNGTSLLGPIEAYDAEYEAIRLATALGIVVVEAGGNGTNNGSTPPLNMDTYTTLSGKAILNRDSANPDFRDSGAIIVSAATSTAPHTRMAWAPHGKRIDCYGWGENVNTLASNAAGSTTAYTSSFSGTSSASPIITGAALSVQGRAQAQLGYRFSPRQMRAILSNPATGTPPSVTETTQMGVLPNLRDIFDTVFNTAPDIYIRDFVGDTGEPHNGSISASPDIILRPTSVANPAAAFGAGSGTENNAALGFTAEAGQDNYIYVRVANQGGSAATNVKATVYWSPVATLVTPDMWTLVGSTTIPSVPVGDQRLEPSADSGHGALLLRRIGRERVRSRAGAGGLPELGQFPPVHPQQQQRHLAQLQRREQRARRRRRLGAERLQGAEVPRPRHARQGALHGAGTDAPPAGRVEGVHRGAVVPVRDAARALPARAAADRQEARRRRPADQPARAHAARRHAVPRQVAQRHAPARFDSGRAAEERDLPRHGAPAVEGRDRLPPNEGRRSRPRDVAASAEKDGGREVAPPAFTAHGKGGRPRCGPASFFYGG
jgi:serine protease